MESTPLSPGDFWRPLTHAGRQRNYLVHVPPQYDGVQPMPAILALHGATSNARLMEKFTGLSDKADAAGFIVVYPSGTGHSASVLTWNGGNGYGYAGQNNVDDVGFLLALVADLAHVAQIDERRVYLAGMSNGAQMAYRVAAEHPDRFAAVAAIAGPLGKGIAPTGPIPVLHIHGEDDQFAPLAGGKGAKSLYGAEFPSVDDTIRSWVRVNRCDPEPRIVEDLPRVDDGTRIVRKIYAPAVELIVVRGGGHTWPNRPPLPAILGKSTSNLDANDTLWDFFERNSR